MLHLLPQEYIRELKSEYNVRVEILSFWLLAIAFALGAVSLVPAFVMQSTERKVLLDRALAVQSSLASEKAETLISFESSLKEKLMYLDESNRVDLDAMEYILGITNDGISLRSIQIEKVNGQLQISIDGTSKTRSELSLFQKKLDESDILESVDIPLSVFTKEKDLDFSLTILVKNK